MPSQFAKVMKVAEYSLKVPVCERTGYLSAARSARSAGGRATRMAALKVGHEESDDD